MPPKTRRAAKPSTNTSADMTKLKNPSKKRTDSVVGEIMKESLLKDEADAEELDELLQEEAQHHEPGAMPATGHTPISTPTKRKAGQKPLDKPDIKSTKAAKLLSPETEQDMEGTPTPTHTPVEQTPTSQPQIPLESEMSADMDVTPTPTPTPAPQASSSGSPSQLQTLKFLLSPAALQLCFPSDEFTEMMDNGSIQRTFHDLHTITPFEELLIAVILSHPLPHSLGLRTIRTLLNPPYSFSTPNAISEAGREKVLQALIEAHLEEMSEQGAEDLQLLADEMLENDWSNDLSRMREQAHSDPEEERNILRWGIRGLEESGLDVFNRRIQRHWKEAFPFVDKKAKDALESMGLPGDANELKKLIEEDWEALEKDLVYGDKDGPEEEEGRMRRAFVDVLQRAVSTNLEGNVGRLLEAAKAV